MRKAIEWANSCNPQKESIPKVGAVITIGDKLLGQGRRGTGISGDDEHAEKVALKEVPDKSELPKATLYTTLEPCTRTVRTKELECCTELILQHKIQRVFIGILDPNQGVTGKGILELQSHGVEVILFPHELAQGIRAINANFIKAQQGLGATILNPKNGDTLKTYETGGKHTIRFKCLNPPGNNNYLVSFRGAICWPHNSTFRHIKEDIWEIDAHFGGTGDATVHVVTASDLGQVLIEYYRKVVDQNIAREAKLKGKLTDEDKKLLGGHWVGIPMIGMPKGFRSEASVTVTIAAKPK